MFHILFPVLLLQFDLAKVLGLMVLVRLFLVFLD